MKIVFILEKAVNLICTKDIGEVIPHTVGGIKAPQTRTVGMEDISIGKSAGANFCLT